MIDRNPQSSVQQTSQSAAQQASRLAAQQPFAVRTTSQEQTIAFGELCAAHCEPDDVLVLTGDLGAGKTHFTKGVARALGVTDQITSPTFAVMCVYQGDELDLFHLDVYRLEDPAALDDIDVPSAFEGGGVSIVEWGDKFLDEMPDDIVICSFARERARAGSSADAEPARIISCTPTGPRSAELVAAWRASAENAAPCTDSFELVGCGSGLDSGASTAANASLSTASSSNTDASSNTEPHPSSDTSTATNATPPTLRSR